MPVAFEGLPLPVAPNLQTPGAVPGAAPNILNADKAQADFLALLGEMLATPAEGADLVPIESTTLEGADDTDSDEDTSDELLDLEEFIAGLCPAPTQAPAQGDVKASTASIATIADSTSKPSEDPAAELVAMMAEAAITEEPDAPAADTVITTPQGSHVQLLTPHHQVSGNQGVVLHHELRAPMGSPAWQDQLGDHLTWMAQNSRDVASLRLNPEHLGPVEVRLSVSESETSVWFAATHPDTRAALEQSLPRLREMFASQGLSLTDAGVFRDPPRDPSPTQTRTDSNAAPTPDESESVTHVSLTHRGLIDTYA